jgi:hypothetical protein
MHKKVSSITTEMETVLVSSLDKAAWLALPRPGSEISGT